MEQVVCPECSRLVTTRLHVTFFGFPKMVCPTCRKLATLPLSRGRRTTYGVIVGLSILITLLMAIEYGTVPIIGLIPALMVAALAMDYGIRQRHQTASARWEELKKQAPASTDPSGRITG